MSQELAALSIALTALEAGLPEGTAPDRRQKVARLQRRSVEIAETIRLLSHELHPGILQYAGLAAALRSHCEEFEREHGGTYNASTQMCTYQAQTLSAKQACEAQGGTYMADQNCEVE